jgi:hypothetical protein
MNTEITRKDAPWLVFGAVGGFLLVLCATGSVIAAATAGASAGIFGAALGAIALPEACRILSDRPHAE